MGDRCPNCGEDVGRIFCPTCGQAVRERRGPLLGLLGDFFTEFFSLDGRHLRTAAKLWIPGRLTQLWLEGKRASHVPPVRVYFVASLLFFLLVGLPTPNADNYNVYIDDVLVGREERDPQLGNMQIVRFDDTGWLGPKIRQRLLPKLGKLQAMPAQELLDRFFAGLERNVPTALICFVPILALALKLLYVRRPFFYVDHLVFALHFQSYLFLTFVLVRLANLAGIGRLWAGLLTYVAAVLLIMPVYLVLALRRVYGQRWPWTVLKGGLLGLLYLLLIQPLVLVTVFFVVRAM